MKNINILVSFAGITFHPKHYLYADEDGIVLADRDLLNPKQERPNQTTQQLGEKQK